MFNNKETAMRFLILLLLITYSLRSAELSEKNLAREIVKLKIENPEFVFKQAMLESGHLKSKLTTEGNNLFGMRWNKRGYCNGTLYGYASYPTWESSVMDYYYWQLKHHLLCYAKDGNYFKKINRIKIKSNILKILRKE